MNQYIAFTKVSLPFGWLGNMAPYPITYNDSIWRTSEALFQAMRFNDPAIKEAIRLEKSPMSAKFKAKKNVEQMVVSPTSLPDIINMITCINLKLKQHPELREKLLQTGDNIIYEDVSSRPHGRNLFWGAYYNETNKELIGLNHLGKIWMDARSKL